MKLSARSATLELLMLMLNDYADEQGIDERWTVARLKRRVSYAMLMELDLTGMMFRAISPVRKDKAPDDTQLQPTESGN